MKATYTLREVDQQAREALKSAGVHPLLARLFAARGVTSVEALDTAMSRLLRPGDLKGMGEAVRLLAAAIDAGSKIVIVADYDCDGASACATFIRGLVALGARRETLGFVVPDRRVHGYGLTPAMVDVARNDHGAEVLVTVDNGIASFEGVDYAKSLGLKVLITDHHLPASVGGVVRIPQADAVVNPCQPGCGFTSKSLCGTGVAFYILLALRKQMKDEGRFAAGEVPRLDGVLDLVALATVTDVVALDENNRRLVAHGLARIRAGHGTEGLAALLRVAGRCAEWATASDLGFSVGPRINAAGRMEDMTVGIECLLADDPDKARELAQKLHGINERRRTVQQDMNVQAEALIEEIDEDELGSAIVVFDERFHEGVIGIVAGRLKERYNRPTFVLAPGQGGVVKGSGRSIAGFHLRDALDLVAKRMPGVLQRFGGHAMAAGCTVAADRVEDFKRTFVDVAAACLTEDVLSRRVLVDGSMETHWFEPDVIERLDDQVWGQAFPAPMFMDEAEVVGQRVLKGAHLKLRLRVRNQLRDAIWFNCNRGVDDARIRVIYRVQNNTFNGKTTPQMIVENIVAA